jgi:hypothetical protein
MWTVQESLILLAISLMLGVVLLLAFLRDQIREWWRRRRG